MTPLARWLDRQPEAGAKERLRRAARLRWQTVHLISLGRQVPLPITAAAIERATKGEVRAVDLLAWFILRAPKSAASQRRRKIAARKTR